MTGSVLDVSIFKSCSQNINRQMIVINDIAEAMAVGFGLDSITGRDTEVSWWELKADFYDRFRIHP